MATLELNELLGSLYESAREKSKVEWQRDVHDALFKAKLLSAAPVAHVTGSDLVLGHETRGLKWSTGVNPFRLRPGTELYVRAE